MELLSRFEMGGLRRALPLSLKALTATPLTQNKFRLNESRLARCALRFLSLRLEPKGGALLCTNLAYSVDGKKSRGQ
jgi:hypothetical protein